MDTDGSRQIIINIILYLIKVLLIFNSRFNNLNVYILCNNNICKKLTSRLFDEGYYITHSFNSIYKIHPILYREKE